MDYWQAKGYKKYEAFVRKKVASKILYLDQKQNITEEQSLLIEFYT